MTATQTVRTAPRTATDRDPVVDLVRSVGLVVVVLLHASMTGVFVAGDGLQVTNAFEQHAGFAALTWVLQVMPIFFVAGGFTALSQWRRMRARGASAAVFIRSRVERLIVPSVAMIGIVVVALAGLTIAGVPEELVHELGYRVGQPLWFLAVFLVASCLVPALAAAHDRAPKTALAPLIGAAVVVDVVSRTTELPGLGFANLAFVWLAVQQLGFWWRDGRIVSGRRAIAVAAGAYGVVAGLVVLAGYPLDMLVGNNNPPTVALIALGVAHLHLVVAARGALERLARRGARPISWLGLHAMTVYLWHMPLVVVLTAALLFAGVDLPEPLTTDWWSGRPVWLVAVLGLSLLAARPLGAISRGVTPANHGVTRITAASGAVLATAGVVVLLVAGFAGASGVVAVALLGGGLLLVRRRPTGVARGPVESGTLVPSAG